MGEPIPSRESSHSEKIGKASGGLPGISARYGFARGKVFFKRRKRGVIGVIIPRVIPTGRFADFVNTHKCIDYIE